MPNEVNVSINKPNTTTNFIPGEEFLDGSLRMSETKPNTFDRSTIGTEINPGKQNVHIEGSHQYLNNVKANGVYKSALTTDAQSLLNDFKAGSGTILENNAGSKSLLVRFNRPIGNVIDQNTGRVITEGTYYGAVKYGNNNVHITPVNYQSTTH